MVMLGCSRPLRILISCPQWWQWWCTRVVVKEAVARAEEGKEAEVRQAKAGAARLLQLLSASLALFHAPPLARGAAADGAAARGAALAAAQQLLAALLAAARVAARREAQRAIRRHADDALARGEADFVAGRADCATMGAIARARAGT